MLLQFINITIMSTHKMGVLCFPSKAHYFMYLGNIFKSKTHYINFPGNHQIPCFLEHNYVRTLELIYNTHKIDLLAQ